MFGKCANQCFDDWLGNEGPGYHMEAFLDHWGRRQPFEGEDTGPMILASPCGKQGPHNPSYVVDPCDPDGLHQEELPQSSHCRYACTLPSGFLDRIEGEEEMGAR